jgi:AP-1-like factor
MLVFSQRAFRERKERRHVKDLEAKLTTLEQQSTSLNSENKRLKRELAKIATENEILRNTSGIGSAGPHPCADDSDEITSTDSLHYTPRDFYSRLDLSDNKGSLSYYRDKKYIASQRITVSANSGERFLAAGATWDYIQQHELFQNGLVDVGDVCERLKKLARCDGHGPVFEERDIGMAIRESAVAGERDKECRW